MGAISQLRVIIRTSIPFVMARRKETGGFGATPRLPATIEDTYHALHILQIAREHGIYQDQGPYDPVRDESLHSYLAASRQRLQVDVHTRFQLLWCTRNIGQGTDHQEVRNTVAARLQASEVLEDWYYYARILRELLEVQAEDFADIHVPTSVKAGNWRTVREAWMHLYLSHVFRYHLPLPIPELIAWFRADQNGDGGFGFFPRTTSFVENCYASLRSLAFLKSTPRNPDLALRFLSGCQTGSGGFGRSFRAASFLDTTWYGLAALGILLSVPSND